MLLRLIVRLYNCSLPTQVWIFNKDKRFINILLDDLLEEEDTDTHHTSDHVGRSLFDYIVEEDKHAVMELMAKYNPRPSYSILIIYPFARFKVTRNSLDTPVMRLEVAGLRSDDQIIPVEVSPHQLRDVANSLLF